MAKFKNDHNRRTIDIVKFFIYNTNTMKRIIIPNNFVEKYQNSSNEELMTLYEVSRSTLQRWAKALSIKKTINRKSLAQSNNAKIRRKVNRNYDFKLIGKQVIKTAGIYKITCIVNSKIYIGSAKRINGRLHRHQKDLYDNKHPNKILQNSYNKYGVDNFSYDVIEKVNDLDNLINREQFWIDKLDSANPDKGFNLNPKAGSMLGFKRTHESKNKVSKKWIITTPTGGQIEIINLNSFCKNNDLLQPILTRGNSHKGFKAIKLSN